MTDIIEVAKGCGIFRAWGAKGPFICPEPQLRAFSDYYRKEGAEESGKVLEQRWETAKLSSKTIVGLREQLAATELVVEQMREALEEIACLGNGNTHGNSIGNCIAIRALQLQPSLSALREHDAKALESIHCDNETTLGSPCVRQSELRRTASELRAKKEISDEQNNSSAAYKENRQRAV